MKKLKKSLKNNLLKVNLNNSYFVLKNIPSRNLDSNNVQNLTRSNIKKIGLGNVIDHSTLKFPLVLETFNSFKDLQKVIDTSVPVVTKFNNLVFKSNTSNLLIQANPILQFVKLKSSIFRVVPLVILIKGYLKLKDKNK